MALITQFSQIFGNESSIYWSPKTDAAMDESSSFGEATLSQLSDSTASPPRSDPGPLPRKLGRYMLTGLLGRGGMAQVYRAELHGPCGFRKPVALKVMDIDPQDELNADKVERFKQEGRLASRLKHPNIIDIYDIGQIDQQMYIAMELVEGMTLAELIVKAKHLPASVVLEIALAIAAGLAKAHDLRLAGQPVGMVHGDLKPNNILVSWNGAIKIADFGAATLHNERIENRKTNLTWGTPSYMSPEQIRMEAIDGRSDLFALALVIFGMVIGANPLGKRCLMRLIRNGDPLPVPLLNQRLVDRINAAVPGLGRVLLISLSADRENRYADAMTLYGQILRLRGVIRRGPCLRDWLADQKPRLQDGNRRQPMLEPSSAFLDDPTGPTHLSMAFVL